MFHALLSVHLESCFLPLLNVSPVIITTSVAVPTEYSQFSELSHEQEGDERV